MEWLSGEAKYPVMPDSGLLIYRNMDNRTFEIQSANGKWNWAKCSGGQYKVNFYSHTQNFFKMNSLNRYAGESTFRLVDRSVKDEGCSQIIFLGADLNTATYMGVNGDSNTCFDIDYNQVYSPWSNPPLPVSNSNDSITIELTGRNGNGDLTVAVYYTNILGASPSKPQGLINSASFVDPYQFNPKISWNRNLEPDLVKYYIYRASFNPFTQQESSAYYFLDSTTDTTYIDLSQTLYTDSSGSRPCAYYLVSFAYKVSAVDNTLKVSVKSERATIAGYLDPCGAIGPMPYANSNSQKNNKQTNLSKGIDSYRLYDNYPNPFNPITTIKFDLPEATFTILNIYDATGKEIMTVLNEFKQKGRYTVPFNASLLSSGIYYYKLSAGNFTQIKKMILLK